MCLIIIFKNNFYSVFSTIMVLFDHDLNESYFHFVEASSLVNLVNDSFRNAHILLLFLKLYHMFRDRLECFLECFHFHLCLLYVYVLVCVNYVEPLCIMRPFVLKFLCDRLLNFGKSRHFWLRLGIERTSLNSQLEHTSV